MKIRIAGNTASPCYFAIKSKGYEIEVYSYLESKENEEWLDYYNAKKDDLFFSATSPEELLGLICMWEMRGDNWRATKEEAAIYREVRYGAPTYDEDGNLIEDN